MGFRKVRKYFNAIFIPGKTSEFISTHNETFLLIHEILYLCLNLRDEKKIPFWIKMRQSCFLGWGSAKSEIIDYIKLSESLGGERVK